MASQPISLRGVLAEYEAAHRFAPPLSAVPYRGGSAFAKAA